MNLLAIPAGLLFALSIPIVMYFRIWPVEGTPYGLFGILFFALIGKVFIDLYPSLMGKLQRIISVSLLILICSIVLGGSTWTAIVDRHKTAPEWGAHDVVLQLEAAMRYLIQGKNPYKETYFGTPVELFRYAELGKDAVNPALYHFVMPPWYLLFPFPVYLIANRTVGYFDVRMVSLLVIIVTVVILWFWIKDKMLKELAVIITLLSPATVSYFIEGRSDPFAFVWLLSSMFFLQKKQYYLSALLMGLGLVSKQTIWFAFPLWIVYVLLFSLGKDKRVTQSTSITLLTFFKPSTKLGMRVSTLIKLTKHIIIPVSLAIGTALLISLPFIIWDAGALLESVVFYLSAGGETGYPVSGYGFSMILYENGIITGIRDYFPFIVVQLCIGLPILFGLIYWIIQKPTMSKFFLSYGIFLFIIWYFSRYFNNSHIAFLSSVFLLGIIFHYDEELSKQN
jgi:hypothetical protein